MQKILSIIVPSYNMEAYLPKCLGSLIIDDESVLRMIDVIVVNDGSKDRTSEIAHKFESDHKGVFRVIDKRNGNYGSCINVALKEAVGFYVKILDADDYVDTRAFSDYLKVLEEEIRVYENPSDLIITDFVTVNQDGLVTGKCDFGFPEGRGHNLREKALNAPRFTVHSITYRRQIFQGLDYWQTEGVSYTDTQWIIEPMVAVKSVRYVPIVVTKYLLGREGQTMNAKVFAKSIGQLYKVIYDIVMHYGRLVERCDASSLDYYNHQIANSLCAVYTRYIMSPRGRESMLIALDEKVEQYPVLYKLTNERKARSRRFDFLLIKEWRRKKSANTIKLLLFRMYVAIARRIGALLKSGNISR